MNCSIFLIFTLLGLLVPTLRADVRLPETVFRLAELEAARERALSKGKLLAFVYSQEKGCSDHCAVATELALGSFARHAVVIFVESGARETEVGVPAKLTEALGLPRSGKYIPKTVVLSPDLTEILEVFSYEHVYGDQVSAKRRMRDAFRRYDQRAGQTAGGAEASEQKAPVLITSREWINLEGQAIDAAVIGRNESIVVFFTPEGRRMPYPVKLLSAESRETLDQLAPAE